MYNFFLKLFFPPLYTLVRLGYMFSGLYNMHGSPKKTKTTTTKNTTRTTTKPLGISAVTKKKTCFEKPINTNAKLCAGVLKVFKETSSWKLNTFLRHCVMTSHFQTLQAACRSSAQRQLLWKAAAAEACSWFAHAQYAGYCSLFNNGEITRWVAVRQNVNKIRYSLRTF